MRLIDIAGKRYGRLVVIERVENNKHGHTMWKCRCDCGSEHITSYGHLSQGKTKSCGCFAHDKTVERNYKHGLSKTPIYSIWENAKDRTINPKNKYWDNYGGNGVRMREPWFSDVEALYLDMGQPPTYIDDDGKEQFMSLDRIDPLGDYCKENCKWSTAKEQANNRTNNTWVELDGVKKTLAQWEESTGINQHTIARRLKTGMSPKEALTKPVVDQRNMYKYDDKEQCIAQWAKEFGMSASNLKDRLFNRGMTISEALNVPVKTEAKYTFTYNGKKQSLYKWSQDLGIPFGTLRNRIVRGMTFEEAITEPIGISLTFNGQTKTIKEWSEETGICYSTLCGRIFEKGWSTEKALTTPVNIKHRRNPNFSMTNHY